MPWSLPSVCSRPSCLSYWIQSGKTLSLCPPLYLPVIQDKPRPAHTTPCSLSSACRLRRTHSPLCPSLCALLSASPGPACFSCGTRHFFQEACLDCPRLHVFHLSFHNICGNAFSPAEGPVFIFVSLQWVLIRLCGAPSSIGGGRVRPQDKPGRTESSARCSCRSRLQQPFPVLLEQPTWKRGNGPSLWPPALLPTTARGQRNGSAAMWSSPPPSCFHHL